MDFHAQLMQIEDLADEGNLHGALERLDALRPGLAPGNAARLHLLQASLKARLGAMDEALSILDVAEALAGAVRRSDVQFEARVTRASVLAALGRYDDAIPMMARVIDDIGDRPDLALLKGDARAELASYKNLISPKTAATFASLLDR